MINTKHVHSELAPYQRQPARNPLPYESNQTRQTAEYMSREGAGLPPKVNTEKNTTDLWRNSVYLISQLYFLYKWMPHQYKAKIQYGKNYIKVTLYPTSRLARK